MPNAWKKPAKTKTLRHKDPLVYTYKSTYETCKKYLIIHAKQYLLQKTQLK